MHTRHSSTAVGKMGGNRRRRLVACARKIDFRNPLMTPAFDPDLVLPNSGKHAERSKQIGPLAADFVLSRPTFRAWLLEKWLSRCFHREYNSRSHQTAPQFRLWSKSWCDLVAGPQTRWAGYKIGWHEGQAHGTVRNIVSSRTTSTIGYPLSKFDAIRTTDGATTRIETSKH